ncbi:MAG TPA: HD domain-containing protein [Pirellulales bacterium]|nr:HD domain-containing protein [Pirellulales bacterium]
MTRPSDFTNLQAAISFALRKHQGQMRKDERTPYAAHPVRVMMLVALQFGVTDTDVLAAAVLHDTIEDTTADRDDLIERFGERVAGYVATLSKDKRLAEDPRERDFLEALASAPIEVKLCKLGDTVDNLSDVLGLDAAARRKAVDKARQLLDRFAPGFPREWRHVLEIVGEKVREVEGHDNSGEMGRVARAFRP